MKYFWMILALGIVGAGTAHLVMEKQKEKQKAELAETRRREEIVRRQDEERRRQEELEEERRRKERMEALAKEDAVALLQRYVNREETRLHDEVEECKLKLQMIEVDKKSLSDELIALESEEDKKAADAKRRKVKRREKNERVDALLSSPTLNRLALTYLGEDLSAMRSHFKSHIGNLSRMSDEKTRRYEENKKKYQQAIKESDDKVNRLTQDAGRQLAEARARLGANSKTLQAKVDRLRADIEKLQRKERLTTLNMTEKRNLESWKTQLDIAEAQLTSAMATEGLGAANKSHLDVTVAESAARRTADTALSARMDDDNAVEAEMNREIAIYNAAQQYENSSLNRIRDAMQHQVLALSERMANAEKKLKYLGESVVNIDFLSAADVEALRKKIAEKMSDKFSLSLED